MNYFRTYSIIVLLVFVAGLCSCQKQEQSSSDKINVFCAAGFSSILNEIAEQYEKENGVHILINFGSSSRLARQLKNGAPADIFISANRQWMEYVIESEIILQADSRELASTDLVLIVGKQYVGQATLTDPENFANSFSGRIAIGDPDHVPAGIYSRQVFEGLGIWPQISKKMAAGSNVKDALRFVEKGECEIGIVYRSTAVSSNNIIIIEDCPEDLHSPIEFLIAKTKSANGSAQAFIEYLTDTNKVNLYNAGGFELIM